MLYRPFETACTNGFASPFGSRNRRPQACCYCCNCCGYPQIPPQHYPPSPPIPPIPSQVSALTTVNTAAQIPSAGAALVFTENPTLLGTSISHTPGSSTTTINSPGLYAISFNGTVTSTGTEAPPLASELQLYQNGVAVPAASASYAPTELANSSTIGFSYLLNVTTIPTTLTVVSVNAETSVSDAVLNVVKLSPTSPPTIPPYTTYPTIPTNIF